MEMLRELISTAKDNWIILTFVLLGIMVYWHYMICFTALRKLGLAGPTPLPIVGNSLELILRFKSLHTMQCKAQRIYGRTYGIYFMKTPIVVVSDPEVLRVIFVQEFQKFHDRLVCIFEYLM